MRDDRQPVLIGAGQFTQRDVDPAAAKCPVTMMAECAARAARDAEVNAGALTRLDTVAVVNVLGWHYANPPGLLAERLGAHPARALYTTVGGNTPQSLVNEVAAEIADGHVDFALLAGGEAINTLVRARRAGTALSWTAGGSGTPTVIGDGRHGSTDHEVAHGLQLPTTIYPLFENALRAHYGRSVAHHQEQLGVLCSRFAGVAAENPYAWFRQHRSAAEIATVSTQNRMIGFPYPKYMNAIMDVDQAAAVLMTSVAGARQLGVPPSRWVYLRGCADAHDHWFVSDRVNYYSSPALRRVGETALAMAGLAVDAIDYFDLYSCFPSAVQIGRDMLGLAPDDRRPLTVTGGLPYHGGPGNNYSMHAIATMMAKLRERPGTSAMVTALGWYVTKHSAGVYSTTPPSGGEWRGSDGRTDQSIIDALVHPALECEPRGAATIETYTVLHDRTGAPMRGIVIGRLASGSRFLANTPDDRVLLEGLMSQEGVGQRGRVASKDGMNQFAPE
jgi:acetyl-CoA C-acetyltransferase